MFFSKLSFGIVDWNKKTSLEQALWVFVVFYSIFQAVLMLVIFGNHLLGPDIQRGAMFETVSRLIRGLSIYSSPTAEYVSGVHNPLFAILGAGFSLVFGESAATLRFVAILGASASWFLVFVIVKDETGSYLAGLTAFSLFASAYLSFDGYLDYANSDSWALFLSLLGLYILNKSRTQKGWFWGILILSLSFWFKQHGAIMAVAGLVYLTFLIRKNAIPYWLLAFVLVPVAYLFVGPFLFGDKFLYYTYVVPSTWSEFTYFTVDRIVKYFVKHWAILGLGSLASFWYAFKKKNKLSIWEITFPFALLVGLLGSLDPGSENNQYIIPSVWIIICGVTVFYKFGVDWNLKAIRIGKGVFLQILILLAFLQNYYYIPNAFFPHSAWSDYNSLIEYINNLDGNVYIPSIGQLPYDIRLKYTASWVQLEDLVRGPGKSTYNNPLIRSILADIINPDSKAYIITEVPLEQDTLLSFLSDNYVLIDDFGDKYKSLRAVPGRFRRGWLRYVYVHK